MIQLLKIFIKNLNKIWINPNPNPFKSHHVKNNTIRLSMRTIVKLCNLLILKVIIMNMSLLSKGNITTKRIQL